MRHMRPGNRQPLERRQHPPQGTAKPPVRPPPPARKPAPTLRSGTTGCHGWVHAHPKRAYQLGYLVHMGKDPDTIPVYYRTGGWQQLNADGTRTPAEPPSDQPDYIPDIKETKKGTQE